MDEGLYREKYKVRDHKATDVKRKLGRGKGKRKEGKSVGFEGMEGKREGMKQGEKKESSEGGKKGKRYKISELLSCIM